MFVIDSTQNSIKTCSSTACIQPAGQTWCYVYKLSSWKMQIQMYQANEVFVNDLRFYTTLQHISSQSYEWHVSFPKTKLINTHHNGISKHSKRCYFLIVHMFWNSFMHKIWNTNSYKLLTVLTGYMKFRLFKKPLYPNCQNGQTLTLSPKFIWVATITYI
jgi:hypothetical protein